MNDELGWPAARPLANGTSGHGNGHGTGSGGHSPVRERPATDSQARAIRAIARQQRIDLENLLRRRFGVDGPEGLSLRDASRLIDELQEATEAAGESR